MPRLEWHYSTRSLLTNLGCRHSSVDSSAPSILLPGFKSQVHHLCFFIYSICAIFVMWKERKKTKSGWVWHFFLKKTAYELIRVCLTCISYLGKLIWFNPVKFDPILKTFLPSFRSSFQNSIFGSIRSLLFWQKKSFSWLRVEPWVSFWASLSLCVHFCIKSVILGVNFIFKTSE